MWRQCWNGGVWHDPNPMVFLNSLSQLHLQDRVRVCNTSNRNVAVKYRLSCFWWTPTVARVLIHVILIIASGGAKIMGCISIPKNADCEHTYHTEISEKFHFDYPNRTFIDRITEAGCDGISWPGQELMGVGTPPVPGRLKIVLKPKFWNEWKKTPNILGFKLCTEAEKFFQTPWPVPTPGQKKLFRCPRPGDVPTTEAVDNPPGPRDPPEPEGRDVHIQSVQCVFQDCHHQGHCMVLNLNQGWDSLCVVGSPPDELIAGGNKVLASIWHLVFLPDFMDKNLNKSIRSKQIVGFYKFLAKVKAVDENLA